MSDQRRETLTPGRNDGDAVTNLSRRDMVKMTAGAGAYFALSGCGMSEVTSGLVTKSIPSSGEQIPVIGIGTARDRFTLDLPPEDIRCESRCSRSSQPWVAACSMCT